MTLEQLRLFQAVAACGTLTAAAERCHLSQPAATHQMHQLEKALGVPLFDRSTRRLKLTGIGERILARAHAVLAEVDSIRRDVVALKELSSGEVRMGGGPTATVHLLPALISGFRAKHPGIRFTLREAHTRDLIRQVVSGDLDVGITTLPCEHDRLRVLPWKEDHIVVVGWPGSPLSQNKGGTASLAGAPFILPQPGSPLRERVEGVFRQADVQPDVVMELYSPEAAKAHVMAGLGYTAIGSASVQAELAGGSLVVLDLPGLNLSRMLGIIFRHDLPQPPAVQAFLDYLLANG